MYKTLRSINRLPNLSKLHLHNISHIYCIYTIKKKTNFSCLKSLHFWINEREILYLKIKT